MQFFDLSRQFNLNDILTPVKTLDELSEQEWYLAKVRVDHDCLTDSEQIEGQVVLKSNQNIQIELEWLLEDNGYELQILFKGIETQVNEQTLVMVNGAKIVDDHQHIISVEKFSLWLDGTLFALIPNLRREIKARLNLWDYVEYDG